MAKNYKKRIPCSDHSSGPEEKEGYKQGNKIYCGKYDKAFNLSKQLKNDRGGICERD